MDPVVPTPDPGLEELRRHRAELRDSMSALEQALAAPVPGRAEAWAERVHVALVELSADLREQIEMTEGADSLYRAVLTTAPRLSFAVTRLSGEHAALTTLVDDLLTCVTEPAVDGREDRVRELGTTLIGRLIRHRQRGADLVYEAYTADIGGET
jgi:hypothetical protein